MLAAPYSLGGRDQVLGERKKVAVLEAPLKSPWPVKDPQLTTARIRDMYNNSRHRAL
jgi:hypothetical protein